MKNKEIISAFGKMWNIMSYSNRCEYLLINYEKIKEYKILNSSDITYDELVKSYYKYVDISDLNKLSKLYNSIINK